MGNHHTHNPILSKIAQAIPFLLPYLEILCIIPGMKISKDLVAASAAPLVLSLLQEGESYGYAIIQRVKDLSQGKVEWTDGNALPGVASPRGARADSIRMALGGIWPQTQVLRHHFPRQTRIDRSPNPVEVVHSTLMALWRPGYAEWEKQLEQWRRQAIAALGSREIVAELEAHLRDAMDRKTQQGATPPEAWQTSLAELGPLPSLKAEFDLAASQKPWILGRCLSGLGRRGACDRFSFATDCDRLEWAQCNRLDWRAPGANQGLAFSCAESGPRPLDRGGRLAFGDWRSLRTVPGCPSLGQATDACRHLARAMMLAGGLFAAGILLGMVWSKLAWGVFWNNDPREYACLAAFLGCLSGWILGRVQAPNPIRWALLSLANGIVAAWALFGPMLWGSGLHAYGQGGSGAWSVLLVVSALGFLPMALAWIPQRRLQTGKSDPTPQERKYEGKGALVASPFPFSGPIVCTLRV